jgi:hypothetical protein
MTSKVGFDPEPVQAWLDEQHGGERLVAFTRVSSVSFSSGSEFGSDQGSVTNTAATAGMLGLDPTQQWPGNLGSVTLLVLTADHFHILHVGGLRPRIKRTLISEPLDRVTFAVRDVEESRRLWRHWIVGLPDGRHVVDAQGMGKAGKPGKLVPTSDSFLAALGDRVRNLTESDTTG